MQAEPETLKAVLRDQFGKEMMSLDPNAKPADSVHDAALRIRPANVAGLFLIDLPTRVTAPRGVSSPSRKRSCIALSGRHSCCICNISVSSTVGRIPGRHCRHRMRRVARNDSTVVLADHRSSEVRSHTQSRSEKMPATLITPSQKRLPRERSFSCLLPVRVCTSLCKNVFPCPEPLVRN